MMKRRRLSAKSVTVYSDGSSLPEYSGAAAVVLDPTGAIIRMVNRVLPWQTSGEAEYAGLILALETARDAGAAVVEVRMDSEVTVHQMTGHYAVNSPRLRKLHWEACELARSFAHVSYHYVPREQNALADVLAAEAAEGREWRLA